ncbi:TIGR02594 family protein [Paraburkholderia terrae]
MVSRRRFLTIATTTLSVAVLSSKSNGRTADLDYDDYTGPIPSLDLRFFDPTTEATKGVKPATIDEEQKAKDIFNRIPKNNSCLELANYFSSIDESNGSGEPYNGGWRERWNPVIRQFFVATGTKPSGDITPWCAAFINWCLMQTGFQRTKNASALSFRSLGSTTTEPTAGDIAVFTDTKSPGHGHVGFYLEQDSERGLLLLGGNQASTRNHHQVCRQWLKKDGVRLKFDSFRSLASIKEI